MNSFRRAVLLFVATALLALSPTPAECAGLRVFGEPAAATTQAAASDVTATADGDKVEEEAEQKLKVVEDKRAEYEALKQKFDDAVDAHHKQVEVASTNARDETYSTGTRTAIEASLGKNEEADKLLEAVKKAHEDLVSAKTDAGLLIGASSNANGCKTKELVFDKKILAAKTKAARLQMEAKRISGLSLAAASELKAMMKSAEEAADMVKVQTSNLARDSRLQRAKNATLAAQKANEDARNLKERSLRAQDESDDAVEEVRRLEKEKDAVMTSCGEKAKFMRKAELELAKRDAAEESEAADSETAKQDKKEAAQLKEDAEQKEHDEKIKAIKEAKEEKKMKEAESEKQELEANDDDASEDDDGDAKENDSDESDEPGDRKESSDATEESSDATEESSDATEESSDAAESTSAADASEIKEVANNAAKSSKDVDAEDDLDSQIAKLTAQLKDLKLRKVKKLKRAINRLSSKVSATQQEEEEQSEHGDDAAPAATGSSGDASAEAATGAGSEGEPGKFTYVISTHAKLSHGIKSSGHAVPVTVEAPAKLGEGITHVADATDNSESSPREVVAMQSVPVVSSGPSN